MITQSTALLNDYTKQARQNATERGLRFGSYAAIISVLQVVFSASIAYNNRGAFIILQHQIQDLQATSYSGGAPQIDLFLYPFLMSIVLCIIFGIITLVIAARAARTTANITQRSEYGRRSGIITTLISVTAWILASVVGAIFSGTDSTFVSIDPLSTASSTTQTIGIAGLVLLRALIIGGVTIGISAIWNSVAANRGQRQATR